MDEDLHSYITVVAEEARVTARVAEKEIMAGRHRGPLHGIPYGLKDNFNTKGIRTTAASRLMLDFVPDEDATLHARLRSAGAILLGKLNTWEFGTGTGVVQADLPFPRWRAIHGTIPVSRVGRALGPELLLPQAPQSRPLAQILVARCGYRRRRVGS